MCKSGQVRWIAFAGAMIFTLGSGLFFYIKSDSPTYQAILFSTLIGIGCGFLYQPSSIAGPSSVKPHQVATVAAWLNFARGLGGIVHSSILTATFDTHLASKLGGKASTEIIHQGLAIADNWPKYPQFATFVSELLIDTFKLGAGIMVGAGIIMGILCLMLQGLDFKPTWWIRQRLAERERREKAIERERLFVPSEFVFHHVKAGADSSFSEYFSD